MKLVGDRFDLRKRQRTAVLRSTCSDAQRDDRRAREVAPTDLVGHALRVDGYNVLITLEAALAGGVLLIGRDGCLRDLASIHGHFKRVEETVPALEMLGGTLATWGVTSCEILLDAPVSNSGRLADLIRGIASEAGWAWTVSVVQNPDGELAATDGVVASADSVVLDAGGPWVNLARHIVTAEAPDAWILDLGQS